jgi:cystathionine beta-lyase/cystathionine gamma-synthase
MPHFTAQHCFWRNQFEIWLPALRGQGRRDTDGAISPFNSFLILQGIETLALRMDRICEKPAPLTVSLRQKNSKKPGYPKTYAWSFSNRPNEKSRLCEPSRQFSALRREAILLQSTVGFVGNGHFNKTRL